MRRRINHEKRNELILERACQLFSELGYPEVTLKLVAKRCGINRTALYRFYNSKRALFDQVIVDLSAKLGREFNDYIKAQPDLTASEKIRMVMHRVLEIMKDNIGLIEAITEYLIDQRRQGESVTRRVHRHTVGLRHLLVKLVREGVSRGEFMDVQCRQVGDILFSQLEAAALQLAITQTANIDTLKGAIDLSLICMKKNDRPQE